MFLIVGLGNPGSEYTKTRHNAGFLAVDAIADNLGISWQDKAKFFAKISTGEIEGKKIILCKPQTYMNISGKATLAVSQFYRIPLQNILVLHDEIELPFAKVRYKIGGGHAGHNGLRSIDSDLGSKEYHRIRLGIGRPEHKDHDVSSYVLANFSVAELSQLVKTFDCLINSLPCFVNNNIEQLKNNLATNYNTTYRS